MGLRVYRYYQDEDGNPVPPPENVYDGMVRDDSGRRTVPFGTSPYSGVELDYGPYDPPGLILPLLLPRLVLILVSIAFPSDKAPSRSAITF